MNLRQWGLPIFVGLIGLGVTYEASTLPLTQLYMGIGAGFFVLVIGLALLVLAGVLAYQIKTGVVFEPEEAEGADVTAPPNYTRLLWAFGGIAFPIVTFPFAGFPIGAALAYACVTRAFGSPSYFKDILIGFVLSSFTWFAFTKLGVQLGAFFPIKVF